MTPELVTVRSKDSPYAYVSHHSGHFEWTNNPSEALPMSRSDATKALWFLNGLIGSPGYKMISEGEVA